MKKPLYLTSCFLLYRNKVIGYINKFTKERENHEKVITYGTFDLFHIGHLNLFEKG